MIKAVQGARIKNIVIIAAIITITVAASGAVYLRFKGNLISLALHYFVEEKVSRALGAKVTMESIKPRIIGPTVLKGFKVIKETPEDTPFIFKADKLIIYNSITQVVFDKLFKKVGLSEVNLVFKIENGCLYKGEKAIFQDIIGFGKIINSNLVFDDVSGRCYNFPLSVHGNVSGRTSKLNIDIEGSSGKLRAKAHLSNYCLRPHAVGIMEIAGARKFYFSGDLNIKPGEELSFENIMFQNAVFARGKIDFASKRFYAEVKKKPARGDLTSSKGVIQLTGDFSRHGFLQGNALFGHLNLGRVDFQSRLDYEAVFDKEGVITGKIRTSGTVVDFRPFKELEGDFTVQGGILKIAALRLGEDYNLSGFINFHRPRGLALSLDIKDSNLSQLLLVSEEASESKVSGRVSGHIQVSGPLDNLTTIAKLECVKGSLGNLDFENMNINLSGAGHILKVADSRILRKQGFIDLSGEVDLKRLWSQQPAKGLTWKCGNEAVVWEGWDIVKQTNSKELQLGKGVGKEKEFMVTFKSYLNDEQSWQDAQGSSRNEAVGVEYSLDEAKKVKMQLKNNEEIFSLENKVRF